METGQLVKRSALAAAVLGGIVGAVLLSAYLQQMEQDRWSSLGRQGLSRADLDAFLADHRRIAALDPLALPKGGCDASPILGPWVGVDHDDRVEPPDDLQWWATPETRDRLAATGWKALPADLRDRPLPDLSALRGCSRLQLEESSAWGRAVADRRYAFLQPLFDARPLDTLARLRAGRALHDGDVPEALRDLRALAALLNADGSVLGSLMAIGLLGVEDQLYREALAVGVEVPADWSPVSAADRAVMKDMLWTSLPILADLAPAGALDEVRAAGEPFWLCAAADWLLVTHATTRSLVERRWPGEIRVDGLFANARSLASSGACEAPGWEASLALPPLPIDAHLTDLDRTSWWFYRAPYSRAFGAAFAAELQLSGKNKYRQIAVIPASPAPTGPPVRQDEGERQPGATGARPDQ